MYCIEPFFVYIFAIPFTQITYESGKHQSPNAKRYS